MPALALLFASCADVYRPDKRGGGPSPGRHLPVWNVPPAVRGFRRYSLFKWSTGSPTVACQRWIGIETRFGKVKLQGSLPKIIRLIYCSRCISLSNPSWPWAGRWKWCPGPRIADLAARLTTELTFGTYETDSWGAHSRLSLDVPKLGCLFSVLFCNTYYRYKLTLDVNALKNPNDVDDA